MKELLYAPLLMAFLIGLYVLAARPKPFRFLWPPNQALLVASMIALGPNEKWWLLAIGWSAAALAVYLFVRYFGPAAVGCTAVLSFAFVVLCPEYDLWVIGGFYCFFVPSMFAWAFAVHEYGRAKAEEGFWK